MAGEQSQFEGLLQNLLSTDNKIRVEAEVSELRLTGKEMLVVDFTVLVKLLFSTECLYTCLLYCTLQLHQKIIVCSSPVVCNLCHSGMVFLLTNH